MRSTCIAIKLYETCQSWDSITSNRPRNFILSLKCLFAFDAQPTQLSNCQRMGQSIYDFVCSLIRYPLSTFHQRIHNGTQDREKPLSLFPNKYTKIQLNYIYNLSSLFQFRNGFLCILNFSLKAFASLLSLLLLLLILHLWSSVFLSVAILLLSIVIHLLCFHYTFFS